MALVDYVSSEESDNGKVEDEHEDSTGFDRVPETSSAGCKSLKRKRDSLSPDPSVLPPLPSKFHDLYASKVRISRLDDPSLHGGRKRITPHIEGNWPSHVYIEWYPSTTEHELLTSLINPIQNTAAKTGDIRVVTLLTSDLGSPLPLHVSLSRPIVFPAAQKDSFLESLHQAILVCGVRPFKLNLSSLSWVSNSENTRWFLVLKVHRPDRDELNRLLTVCNTTVEDYSQPPLYSSSRGAGQRPTRPKPSPQSPTEDGLSSVKNEDATDFSSAFHLSIGWSLEQPSESILEVTEAATNNKVFDSLKTVSAKVDTLKVKVGNIITSISLAPKLAEARSLFGV